MADQKEKIETILKAVAYAFMQFSDKFQKEKTSGELFDNFSESLKEKLGDFKILYDYIWGIDSLNIDGITDSDYIPQDGDSVIMDISVGKDGVWCDVCRTFFVGKASEEQTHLFELVKQSIRLGEEKLKEGSSVQAVYKAVNSVYEREGKKLIHHAGHQIGERPIMEPKFILKSNDKIKSNHFYTIESGCYEKFGIRIENDYLVSENKTENLFENLLKLNIEEYQLYEKEC